MKKPKLKAGDRVWVRVPTNATIIRVNKKLGYTLKVDGDNTLAYFDDSEVEKIRK